MTRRGRSAPRTARPTWRENWQTAWTRGCVSSASGLLTGRSRGWPATWASWTRWPRRRCGRSMSGGRASPRRTGRRPGSPTRSSRSRRTRTRGTPSWRRRGGRRCAPWRSATSPSTCAACPAANWRPGSPPGSGRWPRCRRTCRRSGGRPGRPGRMRGRSTPTRSRRAGRRRRRARRTWPG